MQLKTYPNITIDQYAFYGCSNFRGMLTLPEGLTDISEGVFQICTKLEGSLIFPYSLINIEEISDILEENNLIVTAKLDYQAEKKNSYIMKLQWKIILRISSSKK